jgi:hypothetical protein
MLTLYANEISAAISAFAAIVIAIFTGTLWKATKGLRESTEKLWKTAEDQRLEARTAADRQFEINQQSISLARMEFEYTFRARISISNVIIERGGGRVSIAIKFVMENTGGSPATRLMISFSAIKGPEWHAPTRESLHMAPQLDEMGLVLAPKVAEPKDGYITEFSASDYETAKKGGFYLRIGVIVVYVDGFKERTTWKWFEWHPDSGSYRECAARQD